MLYAKMLRSTHPYARILSIDISDAETMENVKTVLLSKELPITFRILPISQNEHTLAINIVRYVDKPVVAVAAIDEETAEEAVQRIKIAYEDIQPIMSIANSVQPTDTPIQSYAEQKNIHKTIS